MLQSNGIAIFGWTIAAVIVLDYYVPVLRPTLKAVGILAR